MLASSTVHEDLRATVSDPDLVLVSLFVQIDLETAGPAPCHSGLVFAAAVTITSRLQIAALPSVHCDAEAC